MWPMLLDYSPDECKRMLRRLELDAYSGVVSAFRAQGELSKDKKKLLHDLQNVLSIPVERHRAEVRRAVNDEKLSTVADHSNGSSATSEWLIEGRRLVPLLPRLVPQTAFTQTANQAAKEAVEKNSQMINPALTGNRELATQVSVPVTSAAMAMATTASKPSRPTSPTSSVVVLPSGTSIHIKGMLNPDEDEEHQGRRQRRSLSIDSMGAATASTQTQTARMIYTTASSTPGTSSPVKITISKSPQGRPVTQPGGQPPKVILVTSSNQSTTATVQPRPMSVPVLRASTSTSSPHTGPTKTSIIIPGSPSLPHSSVPAVVTVTTNSITTSTSGTVTMPTSVVGGSPVFSPSISIGKPRAKVVTRHRFQPPTKPGVVIPMGPGGSHPVAPSPQNLHNIHVKTVSKPPPIHIKQDGSMKIITQGASKILPKPAQLSGSPGTPVVVVNAGPSASGGGNTTVTMMPKTLSTYTTSTGSKVLNISAPGGRVIATTKASNVVTVNPKTLQLTAVKSAAGGTTVSKPNVIVVQKTQPRRPSLPAQISKGGTTVITNSSAFEKELANFIQKESGRQVSVSISPSGTVSSAAATMGGRLPEQHRVIITTSGNPDPNRQNSVQKLVPSDAENRTSLLAELIQASGLVAEGGPDTAGLAANEWFEFDDTGQSATSDSIPTSSVQTVMGLHNSGTKIIQRSVSAEDHSAVPTEQYYSLEQAMSLLNSEGGEGGTVISSQPVQRIITSTGERIISSTGERIISSGERIVTGERIITGERLITSSGDRIITTGERLISTGERIISGERILTTSGERIITTSSGERIMSGERIISSGERIVSGGERILTPQSGDAGKTMLGIPRRMSASVVTAPTTMQTVRTELEGPGRGELPVHHPYPQSGELDPQTGLFYSSSVPGQIMVRDGSILASQVSAAPARPPTIVTDARQVSPLPTQPAAPRPVPQNVISVPVPQAPQPASQPMDLLSSSLAQAQINLESFDFDDDGLEPYPTMEGGCGEVVVATGEEMGEPQQFEIGDGGNFDAHNALIEESEAGAAELVTAVHTVPTPQLGFANTVPVADILTASPPQSQPLQEVQLQQEQQQQQQQPVQSSVSVSRLAGRAKTFVPVEDMKEAAPIPITIVAHQQREAAPVTGCVSNSLASSIVSSMTVSSVASSVASSVVSNTTATSVAPSVASSMTASSVATSVASNVATSVASSVASSRVSSVVSNIVSSVASSVVNSSSSNTIFPPTSLPQHSSKVFTTPTVSTPTISITLSQATTGLSPSISQPAITLSQSVSQPSSALSLSRPSVTLSSSLSQPSTGLSQPSTGLSQPSTGLSPAVTGLSPSLSQVSTSLSPSPSSLLSSGVSPSLPHHSPSTKVLSTPRPSTVPSISQNSVPTSVVSVLPHNSVSHAVTVTSASVVRNAVVPLKPAPVTPSPSSVPAPLPHTVVIENSALSAGSDSVARTITAANSVSGGVMVTPNPGVMGQSVTLLGDGRINARRDVVPESVAVLPLGESIQGAVSLSGAAPTPLLEFAAFASSSVVEPDVDLIAVGDAGSSDKTSEGVNFDANSLRQSKRKRKPPSALEEAAGGSAGGSWIRAASNILSKVSRYRGANREKGELNAAAWFTHPVDQADAPDYYNIIKNPMDFSTIRKKLESGVYSQFEEFHGDMHLVRDNCFLYNAANTRVYQDCTQVFRFYGQEIDRLLDKSAPKMPPGQTGSPPKKIIRIDKSPGKS